jgi:hypothetical protein
VSCTVAVTVWRTVQNSNAKKPQEFAKIEKKSDLTKKYSIVAMSSYRYIPRIYFAYLVHFFWWISGQSSQNSGWKRRQAGGCRLSCIERRKYQYNPISRILGIVLHF